MVFRGSRSMRTDGFSGRFVVTTREREKVSFPHGTNWTRGKTECATNRFHGGSSWPVPRRDLPKSRGRDVDHKWHIKTTLLSKQCRGNIHDRNQCPGKGKQRNRVSHITCSGRCRLPSNISRRHESMVELWIDATVSRGIRGWKTGSIFGWRRIFWSKQSRGVALYRQRRTNASKSHRDKIQREILLHRTHRAYHSRRRFCMGLHRSDTSAINPIRAIPIR